MKHLRGLVITLFEDDVTYSLSKSLACLRLKQYSSKMAAEAFMKDFCLSILTGTTTRLPTFEPAGALKVSPSLSHSEPFERSRLDLLEPSGFPPNSPRSASSHRPVQQQRTHQGLGIERTGRIPDRDC
jgi:hypothetical protein